MRFYIVSWLPLQSAIGEGMTRRDHADVSNQVLIVTSHFVYNIANFRFINYLIGVIMLFPSSMQIMPLERMSRQ
jgi:hypothetical protein